MASTSSLSKCGQRASSRYGDVVVDDRLFDSFRVPNQNLLIPPIMVNENLVDVSVTPTQPAQAASMDWRPQTAAFGVTGSVNTVAAGDPRDRDSVRQRAGGVRRDGWLLGHRAGRYSPGLSGPVVRQPHVSTDVPHRGSRGLRPHRLYPALERAGVTVAAPPVAPNPAEQLPAASSYTADTRVAPFVSPPYAEYARLILKVSLNLAPTSA